MNPFGTLVLDFLIRLFISILFKAVGQASVLPLTKQTCPFHHRLLTSEALIPRPPVKDWLCRRKRHSMEKQTCQGVDALEDCCCACVRLMVEYDLIRALLSHAALNASMNHHLSYHPPYPPHRVIYVSLLEPNKANETLETHSRLKWRGWEDLVS